MARKSKVDIEEAIRLYYLKPSEGPPWSLADIGDLYGVKGQYIGQLIRRRGFKTRVGGGRYSPEGLAAQNRLILKLLNEKVSQCEIARRLGVGQATINERVQTIEERVSQDEAKRAAQIKAERARIERRKQVAFDKGDWQTPNPFDK